MPEPNVAEGLPEGVIPVADVTKVYTGLKVAGVKIRPGKNLRKGDKIFFTRKDIDSWDSITVDSIERDHRKIDVANEGDEVGVYIGTLVEKKSIIYRERRGISVGG